MIGKNWGEEPNFNIKRIGQRENFPVALPLCHYTFCMHGSEITNKSSQSYGLLISDSPMTEIEIVLKGLLLFLLLL
jgi:hypothetical protein